MHACTLDSTLTFRVEQAVLSSVTWVVHDGAACKAEGARRLRAIGYTLQRPIEARCSEYLD